jgi:lanosterol synthase
MWAPLDIPASPKRPFTDYSRWRLRDTDDGRHVWDFLKTAEELEARPPCNADRYWLNLPLVSFPSSSWALLFLKYQYSLYRIFHRSPVQKVH